MQFRNYSPRSIHTYSQLLSKVEDDLKVSLETINIQQFKDYLHQRIVGEKISVSMINQSISAFKILQVDVLGREWEPIKIKRPRREKKLPVVLSIEEVEKLISVTQNIKHRAILALTYSAGLRRHEIQQIKPTDIDSSRMQVRVFQGKGKKDRYTVLSVKALELLRTYYKDQRPRIFLFEPQSRKGVHLSDETLNKIVKNNAVGVLHTWGQTLVYHPHIHMIVPSGGLSDDQMEWIPSHRKFFLPVKVLSGVFRGILCRLLEQAVAAGDINLPDDTPDFATIKDRCYLKKWVVYCQKPFAGPTGIIQYLGNYTHRVAISNHRFEAIENGKVTFSYKDYKTRATVKSITLEANEFIRQFLQHILPCGFYKIRYFGILALCNVKSKLGVCLNLIGEGGYLPVLEGLNALEIWQTIFGKDPFCCPKCNKGRMISHPVFVNNLKAG